MKPTTFLNLSGGVDSTYYLWRWLQENPKETILIHHCLYFQKRLKEEKEACYNVISYLKERGYTNFKYIETGMQKGTLRGRVLDIEVLCGISSIVVKNHPSVKNVLLSYCREECPPLYKHLLSGDIRSFDPSHRYAKINKVMDILTDKQLNYQYYEGKDGGLISKKEMIQTMPQKLFKLTWYCRRPVSGKPCQNCHTCKKVRAAL